MATEAAAGVMVKGIFRGQYKQKRGRSGKRPKVIIRVLLQVRVLGRRRAYGPLVVNV